MTTSQVFPEYENPPVIIEALFETAKEQYFEDGIESEFSKALVFLIKTVINVSKQRL